MRYAEKREESEIMTWIEKRKIKISDKDVKLVPDDVFRKIKQGKDKTDKKTMAELNIIQHNVRSWNRRLELQNVYRSLDPHVILINAHGLKEKEANNWL